MKLELLLGHLNHRKSQKDGVRNIQRTYDGYRKYHSLQYQFVNNLYILKLTILKRVKYIYICICVYIKKRLKTLTINEY